MQASGSVDPGSNLTWGVIFLQKLSGKSEQDFGILRKVVNSYFKKILITNINASRAKEAEDDCMVANFLCFL